MKQEASVFDDGASCFPSHPERVPSSVDGNHDNALSDEVSGDSKNALDNRIDTAYNNWTDTLLSC
jgi:hypothetical protein